MCGTAQRERVFYACLLHLVGQLSYVSEWVSERCVMGGDHVSLLSTKGGGNA